MFIDVESIVSRVYLGLEIMLCSCIKICNCKCQLNSKMKISSLDKSSFV